MRGFEVNSTELPRPYCFHPDHGDGWIVFDDRGYISDHDILLRELGGNTHEIKELLLMEISVPNEGWMPHMVTDPMKIIKRTAVKLSGKCSPKVGEKFFVTHKLDKQYEK